MDGQLNAASFFRLGLKLIGVFILFTQALPATISTLLIVTITTLHDSSPPSDAFAGILMIPIWWTLGLYLFFGGRPITNSNAVRLQRFCPACSMDLVGTKGSHCAGCGWYLQRSNHRARRWATYKQAQHHQQRAAEQGRPLAEPWKSILEEFEHGTPHR